jgi:nitrogen regulatory protein PII
MQPVVLVFVLARYEKLDKLLVELNEAGIKGATVINTTGMARALNLESDAFLGSIRAYMTPDREDNRTIFMLLNEEKIATAKEVIYRVVGPLNKPETGILFAIPTLFSEGAEIL